MKDLNRRHLYVQRWVSPPAVQLVPYGIIDVTLRKFAWRMLRESYARRPVSSTYI